MGQVHRDIQVLDKEIKTSTALRVNLGDLAIESGTVQSVTAGGRYKVFTSPFRGVPRVALTGIAGNVRLAQTPVAGSFRAQRDAAGTSNAHYMAWG